MANDFSGDANCKALWSFENGALTTDSKGTNTLTAYGAPAAVADLVNFKEKAASVDLVDAQENFFQITDANLDAGFPLKNGDANKKISLTAWMRMQADFTGLGSVYTYIFFKGVGLFTNSFAVAFLYNTGTNTGQFVMGVGYNGGMNMEWIPHGTVIALATFTNRWYHIAVTFQDSDKSYVMRIWDDTAGALVGGAEVTGNSTNNINVEAGGCAIGMSNLSNCVVDHNLDEIVIFDDILSSAEIDEIRGGTFGGGGAAGGGIAIMGSDF